MSPGPEGVWGFLRSLPALDAERAVLLVHILELVTGDDATDVSATDVSNALEDIASPLALEDAIAFLTSVGIVGTDGTVQERVVIDGQRFSLDALRSWFRPPVDGGSTLDVWEVRLTLERCCIWAQQIASACMAEGLPGVPPFWLCEESADSDRWAHSPLARDIGSTASVDVLTIWQEARARRDGSVDAAIEVLLRQSLGLQRKLGPLAGAIVLDQFDDDFVYNFSPGEGSFPTLDASANACSAFARFCDSDLPAALRAELAAALERGLHYVIRSQNPDGSWSIHSSERGGFPSRDMSIRYAILGITDALQAGVVGPELQRRATEALAKVGSFLVDARHRDRATWGESFHPDITHDTPFETTAVLLQPLARLRPFVPADLVRGAADFVAGEYMRRGPSILRRQFRVPTWRGVSEEVASWELPADALVAGGLLESSDLARLHVDCVRSSVAALVKSERHGHWNDLVMAAAGNERAFVSNSMVCVRALAAWCRRSLDELVEQMGAPANGRGL